MFLQRLGIRSEGGLEVREWVDTSATKVMNIDLGVDISMELGKASVLIANRLTPFPCWQ